MIFERDQQESNLNYQIKKVLHMIQLQIMDIQSTLHYVQKKHTLHQIKEVLSQIYNIFNQTEVVFKHCKALFLHAIIKKLMNFFGVIYFMLTDNIENRKNSQNKKKDSSTLEQDEEIQKLKVERQKTQQLPSVHKEANLRPFGGVYLYNQNYSRHLCSNAEPRPKKQKYEQKTPLTKAEFKQEIIDQLNDNSLSSQADEIIDVFTFRFKYGREKEVVTFHDELQSIAKFFKDAQNEAFQFLNRTKDQNANITYNNTFSDIMSQVRIQKEVKLQQFAKKIKHAFRSIKTKTQDKWNEIQHKLEEVKQIKNSIKPPESREWSAQTSYNIDEELKYLNKKIDAAEQKYKLMYDLKRKQVQQSTLIQIQMENQLSLKSRELVYLKIAHEESRLMVSTLNKKIKIFAQNHKKIKQTISLNGNSKEEGIKKLAQIVDAEEFASQCATQSQKISLQSLRKQKKMAKKLIADARRNRTLGGQKNIYAKRFTQQLQGLTTTTKQILQKWGLSQISEQVDIQAFSLDHSIATNRNIMLSGQKAKKNSKSIINTKQLQIKVYGGGMSAHSIKSAIQQGRPPLQSKKKIKNNSQFVTITRPSSFLFFQKEHKRQCSEDSLFDSSESEPQNESIVQNKEQDVKRLQEMYKRQMAKAKSTIIQRKTAFLHQMNQKALVKSKFKTDQPQHRKSASHKMQHFPSKTSFLSVKAPGLPNDIAIYPTNPFRLSANLNQMNTIDEKQEEKDLHCEIKALQTKNKELQQLLDKKNKLAFSLCHKQISWVVEPIPSKKSDQIRKMLKLKSQIQEETRCTELKTDKMSDFRSAKDKKTFYFKDNKTATQFVARPVTQNKTNTIKLTSQSIYSRRQYSNEKSKTSYFSNSQLHLVQNYKKQNKQQMHRLISEKHSKKEPFQRSNTFQSQKQNELQKERKLTKKSNHLGGRQNKNSMLQPEISIPQRISQNIEHQSSKKQEQQQQRRVKQIAQNCKTKQQFRNKINQIHWQRCGKNCKHLQQYMNNFAKYKEEAKTQLKMHVENLNKTIQTQPQLPILNKKK